MTDQIPPSSPGAPPSSPNATRLEWKYVGGSEYELHLHIGKSMGAIVVLTYPESGGILLNRQWRVGTEYEALGRIYLRLESIGIMRLVVPPLPGASKAEPRFSAEISRLQAAIQGASELRTSEDARTLHEICSGLMDLRDRLIQVELTHAKGGQNG